MKKLICTLLAVFILLSFTGCVMSSFEDTNGEADYSLQTITEENILQGMNTSEIMSSSVTVNNKTVCKAQTMSGVVNLFEKRMVNETLDIVVSCQITKGNAQLVLVIDGEIIHNFALNEENQHFTLENVTGKVCLKLAGESAGYSVTYEFQ